MKKEIDDGGPVFPTQELSASGDPMHALVWGLTRRDHFAGLALSALIVDRGGGRAVEGVVEEAYLYANEMIARSKRP